MKENKIFSETESRINEILEQRKADIKIRTQNVEDAKADVVKYNGALDEATKANDLEAYYKAKNDINMSNTLIEMSNKRLDDLKNQPLVNEDEYNNMINSVYGEIEKINNENIAKVVKLIDEILAINKENQEMLDKGNKLLKSLQIDIHQDQDYYKKSVLDRVQYKNTFIAYYASQVDTNSYKKAKEELENSKGE